MVFTLFFCGLIMLTLSMMLICGESHRRTGVFDGNPEGAQAAAMVIGLLLIGCSALLGLANVSLEIVRRASCGF